MNEEKRPWGWKIVTYQYVEDEIVKDRSLNTTEEMEAFTASVNENSVFTGVHMEPVWQEPYDQIGT